MNTWLIPANPDNYDHAAAFDRYGYITWGLTSKPDVGDIVYVRVTGADARTVYKCGVARVGVPEEDVTGSEYWDRSKPFWYDKKLHYTDLKRLDTVSDQELRFQKLKQICGDKNWTNQKPEHLRGPLKSYIESFFETVSDDEAQEITDKITRESDLSSVRRALESLSTSLPPKRRERIMQAIVRDPKIARLIKEDRQYICEICGRKPFIQQNGTPYAEADHIRPLGGLAGGLDTPENMRCLCATP